MKGGEKHGENAVARSESKSESVKSERKAASTKERRKKKNNAAKKLALAKKSR
jgi:hypothetical protein